MMASKKKRRLAAIKK